MIRSAEVRVPKKRRSRPRTEILVRSATVSSFSARFGVRVDDPRDPEPEIEAKPWLELRGVLGEPVRDVSVADFTLVDETAEVHSGARLVPPVYVGPGAVVEDGARLGSLAVLGEGARLAGDCVVENAVVGTRTRVGARARVVGSIIGDNASIGAGCELHNLAVVGPGAELGDGNFLDHGLRIGAGQQIPDDAIRFS